MQSVTTEQFEELIKKIEIGFVHMETRDAYGTATELPHLAQWRAGEHDDLAWLEDYCTTLRRHTAAGRTMRRAHIVSEPLSEYQRWAYSITHPMVDAGEDIRWVPRPRVSAIGIPGNDYYLFDDRLALFLHYAGSGLNVDFTTTTDPDVVELCRSAFEEVWKVSIPHGEYRPH